MASPSDVVTSGRASFSPARRAIEISNTSWALVREWVTCFAGRIDSISAAPIFVSLFVMGSLVSHPASLIEFRDVLSTVQPPAYQWHDQKQHCEETVPLSMVADRHPGIC